MIPTKKSININGRKTSVSVEDAFWNALRDISRRRRSPMIDILAEIDLKRPQDTNLTSAVRVWIMEHFQTLAIREAA